eukprot:TRINITY_DN526_c0_g2_i7.p1 TRINITY_DN526_c0_g2~~TRINITY_DN526_c0_g2_i7.p1  ORF type:complete len:1042 (-),score=152.68 TRINITY_DN526_c0_g2_i7:28-3153(-)
MSSYLVILLVIILLLHVTTGDIIPKREQLSSRRDAVGGIRVEDRFYFAGGFEFNDIVPSKIVDIYNITSGEWEEPIYLEEARGFISTAVIGENIYFVGGTQYLNCSSLYNTTTHQYDNIGCGPTVRRVTQQLSTHNSTVTVLGAFSVDFYDITSNTWYYKPKLTSRMQNIFGGITAVHENKVFGIGGINTTTLDSIFDAWIYNTDTDEITVLGNVTTRAIINLSFGFAVAHNRVVIYISDRYFLHEFDTTEWREELTDLAINNAVILSDYVFLFDSSTKYIMYEWNTTVQTHKTMGTAMDVYAFEDQVVIRQASVLNVFEAGQWTTVETNVLGYYQAVRWFDKYAFTTSALKLQLYDSKTKTVTNMSPNTASVSSLLPFDETRLIFFSSVGIGKVYIYNLANDSISDVIFVGMSSGSLIGTDIVSLSGGSVWIDLSTVQPLDPLYTGWGSTSAAVFGVITRDYDYIDIFNYVTREWKPRVSMGFTSVGGTFALVVAIDDILVVAKKFRELRYNTTSGGTSVAPSLKSWPIYDVVNTIPVVNHTGYLPGNLVSTIISIDATSSTFRDDLNVAEKAKQFVTTHDNVIYMATLSNGQYYSIFTYDIINRILDTLVLPSSQSTLLVATVNDTVLALGSDGSIYGLLRSDRATWYKTPMKNEFIPTIITAMDDGTAMIAGGKHYQFGFYTDEILFINASAVIEMGEVITTNQPPLANNGPDSTSIAPHNSLQPDLSDGELAAAIVVPIVVAGGAVALIVILVKRRDNKKKGTSKSSLGLEARYGTWFTPFDQIAFGEQLGQGANGQVFKGTWKSTTVALKVSMTQANSSVISELELMMQLRPHPNVVQLLGFSVHPETDSIILIIEFCEGGSLDTKLYNSRDEISIKTQIQWLTGIAKGLSHLHSNNVVHRDVAARNVLVHRNEPKLTDFGMSRLVDEQKQHGTTKSELGPIRWMSPESLKNKEYSAKSDVWSFGIVMFEIVAREEPHANADPIEIGRLIRDSGLTPVIPPSCHPQLAEIMRQCWEMSSQSRPKIESIIQSLESIH